MTWADVKQGDVLEWYANPSVEIHLVLSADWLPTGSLRLRLMCLQAEDDPEEEGGQFNWVIDENALSQALEDREVRVLARWRAT